MKSFTQLEFDFVREFSNKKSFSQWISDHMEPEVDWYTEYDTPCNQNENKDKWNSVPDILRNVKEHLMVGFKFVWRF